MKKNNPGAAKTANEAPKDGKSGLVQEPAQTLKDDLNITPQTVTQAVIRDAKQAVNYEIRRGFRDILKGIFSK